MIKKIIKHCDNTETEIRIHLFSRSIEIIDWIKKYGAKIGKVKKVKYGYLSFIKVLFLLLVRKRPSEFLFNSLFT